MKSYRRRISLFALVLVVLLAFGSVSAFAAPAQTAATDVSTPEGAFNAYMTAIKKADYKTAQKYTGGGTTAPDEESIATVKLLGKYLTWTVDSVSETENTATLEVSVTNVKLTNFFRDVLRDSILDDVSVDSDMTAYLADYIKNADKVVTIEVTVPAIKRNGTWCFIPNDDFMNAYMGNLINGMYDFSEELFDSYAEDGDAALFAYLLAE